MYIVCTVTINTAIRIVYVPNNLTADVAYVVLAGKEMIGSYKNQKTVTS